MSIRLVTDKENVDYQAVADILDHFGLSHFDAATEEKIFKNSYATAFIYDGDQVVGCARAISDGVCQAAIYNVALLEEGYRFGDNDYERQPYCIAKKHQTRAGKTESDSVGKGKDYERKYIDRMGK
jgi:acetyltransferase, GNAT family